MLEPLVRGHVDTICSHDAGGCHPHFRGTVVNDFTPGETHDDGDDVEDIVGKGVIVGGIEAVHSHSEDVVHAGRDGESDRRTDVCDCQRL